MVAIGYMILDILGLLVLLIRSSLSIFLGINFVVHYLAKIGLNLARKPLPRNGLYGVNWLCKLVDPPVLGLFGMKGLFTKKNNELIKRKKWYL